MSFIPSNNPAVNAITTAPGSGLGVATNLGVSNLTTIAAGSPLKNGFIAGSNISFTRNTANNTLTISSSAGGVGITDIEPKVGDAAATGCGISITTTGTSAITANIVGAYVSGTGISLTPQGGSGNPHVLVNNTMDVTSQAGSGITVTQAGAGQDADVAVNLTAGSGVAITAGTGTAKVIANTMDILPGSGISVAQSGPGADATITNTGVVAITTGSGISASGSGTVNLTNTGVLAIAPGSGISASGTGTVTVANTMDITANQPVVGTNSGITVSQSGPGADANVAVNLSSGAGITMSNGGGTQRIVTNSGVLSITGGAGISVSGTGSGPFTGNVTISAASVSGPAYYVLSQPDPSTYGYGYITNGNALAFGVGQNLAFNALLASATALSVGRILFQFTLQLSSSPATPPGGPITVQIIRNGIAITLMSINSSTVYPSPYQTGGSYTIYAVANLSDFAGSFADTDIRVINNYGAVIYATMLSPVIVQYVPTGIAT